jgi:hypothetical protein
MAFGIRQKKVIPIKPFSMQGCLIIKKIMRSFLCVFLVCLSSISLSGQYSDPNFPKPSSGYGADGTHTVGIISFTNPNFLTKKIEIYYPSDITTKVPAIFYSHAYGGNNSDNISGFLNFVAMKGYAIVFVPYQTTGVTNNERYANLLEGFRLAARNYPSIIDTTRVGFVGWSFGGGASFANAYTCFTENNWGSNGRFIYAMAQWYSLNITQEQLQSFPSDTKLLTEIFNDDETNDHRMAVDIFNTINIPVSEKDYIMVKSDTIAGYAYTADHTVPQTSAEFDALDYYAIFRLFDALCDYTFYGNSSAKEVALGNGSDTQITMPAGLKKLVETDTPVAIYPQNKYLFPCTDTMNARSAYCPAISYYSIEAIANPSLSGNITGTGYYTLGKNVMLAATPSNGFTFADWTENGTPISTGPIYTFTATSNRNLTANFLETTGVGDNIRDDLMAIYPNPTDGIITISPAVNINCVTIIIYDLSGKKILTAENVQYVDLSRFLKGIYLMTVNRDGQTWKYKVVKN